jgi:hypothetical protein
MAKCEYFVDYSELESKPLSEIKLYFETHEKKEISHVEISELATINPPNGIYLFYNPDNNKGVLYVGKATSRSFIERLPAHFDPREKAWFNSLPKKVELKDKIHYSLAHKKALSFKVLIVGIEDSENASHLERILRSYLQPFYNNTPQKYEGNEYIQNV